MARSPTVRSTLRTRIKSAATNLTVAGASYDIWQTYKMRDSRRRYLPGMQHYSEFFRYDEEAHFRTLVVSLYTLFDGRKDTANFYRLLADSRRTGTPLPGTEARLAVASAVADKVEVLRHNLFAHRNHGLTYEDAYRKANLTGDELRGLLDESRLVLNELGAAHGVAPMDFSPFVLDHMAALLTFIQPVAE